MCAIVAQAPFREICAEFKAVEGPVAAHLIDFVPMDAHVLCLKEEKGTRLEKKGKERGKLVGAGVFERWIVSLDAVKDKVISCWSALKSALSCRLSLDRSDS